MLKKLICDKRLAPIFHGKEVEEDVAGLEECPICFLVGLSFRVPNRIVIRSILCIVLWFLGLDSCVTVCPTNNFFFAFLNIQHYPGGLNRTKCCKKGMCTEVRTTNSAGMLSILTLAVFSATCKSDFPIRVASCPFCNHPRLLVVFLGPKSQEEELSERVEKQKVEFVQIAFFQTLP